MVVQKQCVRKKGDWGRRGRGNGEQLRLVFADLRSAGVKNRDIPWLILPRCAFRLELHRVVVGAAFLQLKELYRDDPVGEKLSRFSATIFCW